MTNSNTPDSALRPEDIRAVSPALASYKQKVISEDVWKCPELSPRNRSLITVAALIARIQTIGMLHYFNIALDRGVTPGELSEVVTHLAFYSGCSNVLSAVPILKDIFAQRGIGIDQLPEVSPELLALNEQAEAQRADATASIGDADPLGVLYRLAARVFCTARRERDLPEAFRD